MPDISLISGLVENIYGFSPVAIESIHRPSSIQARVSPPDEEEAGEQKAPEKNRRVLIIRHGEKAPDKGVYNLSCRGMNRALQLPDDDFDSIWIIDFTNGKALLTFESKGMVPSKDPSEDCSF
ncbi:MAG TPA: hypothetical protein VFS61_10850 [Anaerolineales bacterium]|nr:hypothetical protein [Anaerolineales bacterium]